MCQAGAAAGIVRTDGSFSRQLNAAVMLILDCSMRERSQIEGAERDSRTRGLVVVLRQL